MPLDQIYGQDASGDFGLFPVPPSGSGVNRVYEFVGDGVGSNWERLGTSAKGFDKVGHCGTAGTITKIAFAAEDDPGATEVRILRNGTSAATHTFTNKTGTATVSVVVTDGEEITVEARSVADPKPKDISVTLIQEGS